MASVVQIPHSPFRRERPGAAADPVRAAAPPDLVVSNVRKSYGDQVAVDGVSLEIPRGQFVTLLGPSGCGKTTLLRMIAGLEAQTSGSIALQGRLLDGAPAHERNVNTVFQNYALFPHLTVEDNVAFGLNLKKLPAAEVRSRVESMLQRVQMANLAKRRPHELSGGQQQRVSLARALVNQPALLLLDEPLGALDLKLRREMQLELKHLQRQLGISFVYVTHDQEEALTLSDTIVLMLNGRIVQVGSPEDIYRNPKSRFAATFLGTSNLLSGVIRKCDGAAVTVLVPQLGHIAAMSRSTAESVQLRMGDHCALSLRPEEISLDSATATDNVLTGVVDDLIFIGTKYQVLVKLANGQIVECLAPAGPESREKYSLGTSVQVSWPPTVGKLLAY